jgi:hypothetical protein
MNKISNLSVTKFLAFMFLLVGVCITPTVRAQSLADKPVYRGFMGSFAMHSFKSSSNFRQLDAREINLAGGQVGVVLGTKLLRYELGLYGYYSSVNNVCGTIDLHTNSGSVKFYPLQLFGLRHPGLEPYVTGGFDYDRFKFYGNYAQKEAPVSYSAQGPYIGTLRQINATVGAGFELNILNRFDFVHLFSEVKYVLNVANGSSSSILSKTAIADRMIVNVGISFGAFR